jgi:HSP20 family protein
MLGHYNLNDQFLNNFRNRVRDLFEDEENHENNSHPLTNVFDNGEALIVKMELPAVLEEEMDISLLQNILTIEVNKEKPVPEGYKVHRKERTGFNFKWRYKLPYKIDNTKVNAKLENGVLTLTMEKHAEEKPRTIKINVN